MHEIQPYARKLVVLHLVNCLGLLEACWGTVTAQFCDMLCDGESKGPPHKV